MGASDFKTATRGKTATEAFQAAKQNAQYEHGHGGYTGTIAEKHNFVMIDCPEGIKPAIYADQLIDDDDPRVCDKWGPAGCIDCGEGRFLFFGLASS